MPAIFSISILINSKSNAFEASCLVFVFGFFLYVTCPVLVEGNLFHTMEHNFLHEFLYKCLVMQCLVSLYSLQEVQQLTTVPELELFLLEHGEEVIDMLGQQVDRIEKNIKVK